MQVYVVQLAQKVAPNAVDVASGLNIAAFNIGIASGSIIGSNIVNSMQLSDTAWIGALITLITLVVTRFSGHLDKRMLAKNNKV